MLSFDGEYINWKSFITAVAQPIMLPSNEELMETLAKFKVMDQKSMGYVTREQYDKVCRSTYPWVANYVRSDVCHRCLLQYIKSFVIDQKCFYAIAND